MSLLEKEVTQVSLRVIETAGDFSAAGLQLQLGAELRILPGRREVYSGHLQEAGLAVVAKRFLPHAKQVRDWRREWQGLLALNQLLLSAPSPICVAESSDDGAIWVLMQEIEGLIGVAQAFQQADLPDRQEMMCRLVELVDEAHRNGVWQRDQHVDNWAWDGRQFYLLDAGTVAFEGEKLTVRDRLTDLAGICVTLLPAAEQLFRKNLELRYMAEGTSARQRLFGNLEHSIQKLQYKRIRRYSKKTRRSCTEFCRVAGPRYHSVYARGAEPELVERFIADPESLMQLGECLKDGNTCTVQGFSYGGNGYVLKRYNQKSRFNHLRRALCLSRAMKSWSHAWVLEMAFIPTARGVAVCEDRSKRLAGCRYLLMERIEGRLLTDYLDSCAGDQARVQAIAREFARMWRLLGRLGASHGDMKATNWIVGNDGQLYLFDLDAFRFGLRGLAYARGRQRDWKRFMRNWKRLPSVAKAFEMAVVGHCRK